MRTRLLSGSEHSKSVNYSIFSQQVKLYTRIDTDIDIDTDSDIDWYLPFRTSGLWGKLLTVITATAAHG